MPKPLKTALLLFTLSVTLPGWAGELHLDYGSFYSHLKKLNNEELAPLQFAFGFVNVRSGNLCEVQRVKVHTDKQDIPVEVNAKNRFVLPYEKALKLAKAEVWVNLKEANNQCDLSVQLEVNPVLFSQGVSRQQLQDYFLAFDAFFDKMGGFLSFMMPSPEGVGLRFKAGSAEQTVLLTAKATQLEQNKWVIHQDAFSALGERRFSDIEEITAYVPK